jgi:hypothetical protein
MWYIPTRDIERLRADCLKVGNVSPSTWVLLTLNGWMNRKDVGEEQPPEEPGAEVQNTGFKPEEDSPAEPYWALFAVDEKGQANGAIWTLEFSHVVLFMDDHIARKVAPRLPPPRRVRGLKEATTWAVRGVTSRCLEYLQSGYHLRTVPGVLRDPELLGRIRKLEMRRKTS